MKAYAYFDEAGILKEFIIDPSVRQGNQGVNEIMIYMHDDWNGLITGDAVADDNYLYANVVINTTQNPTPISQFPTIVDDLFYNESIPAIKDYDPKFFKYGQKYNFVKYEIPSAALAVSGYASMSLYILNSDDETVQVFGIIPFAIEDSAAIPSPDISWSEYLYLLRIAQDVNNKINKSGLTTVGNMTWKDTANRTVLSYNPVSGTLGTYVDQVIVQQLSYTENENGRGVIEHPDGIFFDILGTKPLKLEEDTAIINEVFTFKFNSNYDPQILIKKNGNYAPLILESSNFSINANTMGYRDFEFGENANGCYILADGENLTLTGVKVSIESSSSDIDITSDDDVNVVSSYSDINIQANNDISLKAQLITIYSQTQALELAGEQGINLNCHQDDLTTTNVDNIVFASNTFTWNSKNVATENYVDNAANSIWDVIPSETSTSNKLADKAYVQSLIESFKANEFLVVDTTDYPTLADFLASTGEEGYIYLYPVSADNYDEYIWEESDWLKIGTTSIDLSNYFKKDANNTLSGNNTFSGNNTHTGLESFSGRTALFNTRLETNSKNYFARVGVTTGQYINYSLPLSYADVGSEATYTLATQEYADGKFMTKATDETVTGIKTFEGDLKFKGSGVSTVGQITTTSYSVKIGYGGTNIISIDGNAMYTLGADYDLGTSSKRWRDIVLSRNLSDGTNTVAIGQLTGIEFTDVIVDEE